MILAAELAGVVRCGPPSPAVAHPPFPAPAGDPCGGCQQRAFASTVLRSPVIVSAEQRDLASRTSAPNRRRGGVVHLTSIREVSYAPARSWLHPGACGLRLNITGAAAWRDDTLGASLPQREGGPRGRACNPDRKSWSQIPQAGAGPASAHHVDITGAQDRPALNGRPDGRAASWSEARKDSGVNLDFHRISPSLRGGGVVWGAR